MTQDSFPIVLPSEKLVLKWDSEWHAAKVKHMNYANYIATQAANWGADQELKACCEWLRHGLPYESHADYLRDARRPKPPSLKEQALALISHDPENQPFLSEEGIATVRRALESLPD